jgi:hypothetical protein
VWLKPGYDIFIIATKIIVPFVFWGTVTAAIDSEKILASCIENSSCVRKYGFYQQDHQCLYNQSLPYITFLGLNN